MYMLKGIVYMLLSVAVIGCGNQSPREISETRMVTPSNASAISHDAALCPMEHEHVDMPSDHPPLSNYQWTLPEGWSEIPPTPFRVANLAVDAHPDVECYVTVLTGIAGGVEANMNRWRQQMGQPALGPEEIEAMPQVIILGQQSPFIEIAGDFMGMTGQQASDYKMLAVICSLADETIFVKMTGPASAVRDERERFLEFCASLKEGTSNTNVASKQDE